MSPKPESPTARLFIALWPDAATRARLAGFRDRWRWRPGARPVVDADLHATLHFIGSFERRRVVALGERLAAVPTRRVVVRPEATAIWPGGIAVLILRGDAALAALHEDIGTALLELGVALEARPFAPHVTLARKAARAEPPAELPELVWCASGFVLVETRRIPPANYVVLAAWGEPVLSNGADAAATPAPTD